MPEMSRAERSESTRAILVQVARKLFAERGYAGVGTEEIVRELTVKIATAALGGSDPIAALRAGTEMFLDACLEPEVQRIVLLDAPAVLGGERWRAIAAEQGLGL